VAAVQEALRAQDLQVVAALYRVLQLLPGAEEGAENLVQHTAHHLHKPDFPADQVEVELVDNHLDHWAQDIMAHLVVAHQAVDLAARRLEHQLIPHFRSQ
jgi:hypothetical protein